MTKGNKQNGRQPPVSQVSAPCTNPRYKSLFLDRDKICRDFIWGICLKGSRCAYSHERDLDHMKVVLKFCHDFQNKSGCLRPDCTYLHTSREEQIQFINRGTIPKVLIDRYAAMAAATASENEIVNKMTFNREHKTKKSNTVVLVPSTSNSNKSQDTPISEVTIQPPPLTVVTTTVQAVPQNILSTAEPQVPKLVLNQPKLPTIYDVTQPPPKLNQVSNKAKKRAGELIKAEPCKARKQEERNGVLSVCKNCVHRELRINELQDENEELQDKKECKALLIKKSYEDYDQAKLLLKPLINPDVYQIMDEYFENLTSELVEPAALLEMNPSPSSLVLSDSTKAHMTHLLDHAITNGNDDLLDVKYLINGIPEDLSPLSALVKINSDPDEETAMHLIQTLLLVSKDALSNTPIDIKPKIDLSVFDKLSSEPQSYISGMNTSMIVEFTQYHSELNSPLMIKSDGTSTPTDVKPLMICDAPENETTQIVSYHPSIPPPRMLPIYSPLSSPSTSGILNATIVKPLSVPPTTVPTRPFTPIVHPPMFTVPPPKLPIQSPTNPVITSSVLTVRQSNTPTPVIHTAKADILVIPKSTSVNQSPKPIVHTSSTAFSTFTSTIQPNLLLTHVSKPATHKSALAIRKPTRSIYTTTTAIDTCTPGIIKRKPANSTVTSNGSVQLPTPNLRTPISVNNISAPGISTSKPALNAFTTTILTPTLGPHTYTPAVYTDPSAIHTDKQANPTDSPTNHIVTPSGQTLKPIVSPIQTPSLLVHSLSNVNKTKTKTRPLTPSILPATTSTKQTPKSAMDLPVPTMQSPEISNPSPTSSSQSSPIQRFASQSTPIKMPASQSTPIKPTPIQMTSVIVQDQEESLDSTGVQSASISSSQSPQKNGSAKCYSPPRNGKIIALKNGHVRSRPYYFPHIQ